MFEMNDVFIEDCVKGKKSKSSLILAIVFLCLAISCFAVLIVFHVLPMVLCLLILAFFGLASMEFKGKNIEFEYDFTNGSLEIAKIINNERRKKVVEIQSENIRLLASSNVNEYMKYDNVHMKIYDCSSADENDEKYVMVVHDSEKNSDFKVYFSPSDNLVEAMRKYNKSVMYLNN